MQGYENSSYGEAFADIYDDWYDGISDVSSTVTTLNDLIEGCASRDSPVVELGVGTGRIAIPLARRVPQRAVWGIDSSPAMIERLSAKQPPPNLQIVIDDMVDGLHRVCPGTELGLIFVAFNTLFNLDSRVRQQQCLDTVALRLAPGGCFVVEAFVPRSSARSGDLIEVKAMAADHVVLSITRFDGGHQVEGQFVEFTAAGGVRLRPWSIRYVSPADLDIMAATAGLTLRHRWSSFDCDDFGDESPRHVSVYVLDRND